MRKESEQGLEIPILCPSSNEVYCVERLLTKRLAPIAATIMTTAIIAAKVRLIGPPELPFEDDVVVVVVVLVVVGGGALGVVVDVVVVELVIVWLDELDVLVEELEVEVVVVVLAGVSPCTASPNITHG
jgi:hypothetical protein